MSLFLLQGRPFTRYFQVMRSTTMPRANLPLRIAALGIPFGLLISSIAHSSPPPDETWPTIRSAYEQGRFEEALKLLEHQDVGSTSYYNLGTLFYRTGQVGRSVAYLEKARQLNPGDQDIQHNLKIARDSLRKLIGSERMDPGASSLDIVLDQAQSQQIRSLFALLTLTVVLVGFRKFLISRNLEDLSTALSLGSGLFLLLCIIMVTQYPNLLGAQPSAIAIDRQVVRSGPGDQFLQLAEIEAGTKVRLTGGSIESTSDLKKDATKPILWHQVKFSENAVGWVRESDFLLL